MNLKRMLAGGAMLLASMGALSAAPQLRISSAAIGPVAVAQGKSGPTQTVDTANAGDGALNLSAASSVAWLTPTLGAAHACSLAKSCVPLNIALQTATLAAGAHTGIVTLTDPNAVDAPQTVTVTVQIGSAVPAKLEFFVAPGGAASATFTTASAVHTAVSFAGSSSGWLAISTDGAGTFQFSVPYKVTAAAAKTMAAADYSGSIAISGSSLAADNAALPVTMHVTTQPIATPSVSSLHFVLAQNSVKQTQYVSLANAGGGTLTAGAVSIAGAAGLTAQNTNGLVSVIADSTGATPGSYPATLTIASNAANATLTIPVLFDVLAQAPPSAAYRGAVNNATFQAGETAAPGDILALFGSQFLYSDPQSAKALPLPSSLPASNGTQVLVNGQPAPLYYASYNQINFQLPSGTQPGQATVQVVRNGQPGNKISLQVSASQPRLLYFFGTANYGIIQNASQGNAFPIPAAVGAALGTTAIAPAKAGSDILVIYAIGLGATSPSVPDGAGAPGQEPLARVALTPNVFFGATNPFSGSVKATPSFAGLTPFLVGLYQVNVLVPANTPKGDSIPLFIANSQGISNTVYIAVK